MLRKMRLLSASLGKHKEPISQLAPRAGARREPSQSGPLRDGLEQGEASLEVGMQAKLTISLEFQGGYCFCLALRLA